MIYKTLRNPIPSSISSLISYSPLPYSSCSLFSTCVGVPKTIRFDELLELTEKLLYSQLWFIAVKGYILKSAKKERHIWQNPGETR